MEFNIGDTVFVCDKGKARSISSVSKVMKRFVELEDGSKWRPDGIGRYPYRRWDASKLRPYQPDSPEHPVLLAECNRYISMQRIKSTNFDDLDTEALVKIVSIIDSSVQ